MTRSAFPKNMTRYAVMLTGIGLGWLGGLSSALAAQVGLAWTQAGDTRVAGYQIAYGTSSGNLSSLVDAGNTASFNISGLQSGTSYYFAIRSYNAGKSLVSSFTNQVSATTPASAPANPAPGTTLTTIYGPATGDSFVDQVPSTQRLNSITVRAGWAIDSVQAVLSGGNLAAHGGAGGAASTFSLASDEYLVRIDGKYAKSVSQLTFTTNKGKVYGPYGEGRDPDGTWATTNFSISAASGNELVGFAGRSGTFVNALAAVQRSRTVAAPPPVGATPVPTSVPTAAPTPATTPPPGSTQYSPVYGGTGGTAFTDLAGNGQTLTGLRISAGWAIDSAQIFVGGTGWGIHGGTGGAPNVITLASNEYIVGFSGSYGKFVNKLSFRTNLNKTFGPYGDGRDPDGAVATNNFDFSVPAGNEVVGLTGRAGTFLNAVAVVYRSRAGAGVPAPTPTATPTPVTPSATSTATSSLYGGTAGTSFTDQAASGQKLTGITVRAGWAIDAVQVFVGGNALTARGGTGGSASVITLANNEYIVGLSGSYGKTVNKLSFTTNLGKTFGPYGAGRDPDGVYATGTFGFTVPAGYEVSGLTGRASTFLNALGVVYRPHAVTAPETKTTPAPTTAPVSTSSRTAGLVAAYDFEEAQGDAVLDVSGNGNHGVATNTTRIATGKFGHAMAFNGDPDSFVTVPDAASLRLSSAMTLEAWVYRTSNEPNWGTVIAKELPGGVAYYLYANSFDNDHPLTGVHDTSNGYSDLEGPSAVAVNKWVHLVGTYDGHVQRLYVDARLVSEVEHTGAIATSDGLLRIGGDWAEEGFIGYIDEVRVFNRALSADEIAAERTRPATDTTAIRSLVGTTAQQSGSFELPAGRAFAYLVDAGQVSTGKLSGLSVFIENGASVQTVAAGIYTDANGQPGTMQSSTSLANPVNGWNTLPVPAITVQAGKRYWLALMSPFGKGNLVIHTTPNGAGLVQDSAEGNLNFLPSTWHMGTQSSGGPLAMYGSGY